MEFWVETQACYRISIYGKAKKTKFYTEAVLRLSINHKADHDSHAMQICRTGINRTTGKYMISVLCSTQMNITVRHLKCKCEMRIAVRYNANSSAHKTPLRIIIP